jgi:CIC family chloride channel protein
MAILMIFEMTLDYNITLPLMLACVVAYTVARDYRGGTSIYAGSLRRKR